MGGLIIKALQSIIGAAKTHAMVSGTVAVVAAASAYLVWQNSGTDAVVPRAVRPDNTMSPARKGYRDLKGRSFDKQIPYRVMF